MRERSAERLGSLQSRRGSLALRDPSFVRRIAPAESPLARRISDFGHSGETRPQISIENSLRFNYPYDYPVAVFAGSPSPFDIRAIILATENLKENNARYSALS